MENFRRVKCYITETDETTVSENIMLFKPILNVFGDRINDSKLQCTTNETYIRNTLLINQGRAATSSKSKVKLYHFHIVADEPLTDGDYTIDDDGVYGPYEKGDISVGNFKGKIVASTDKTLNVLNIKNADVIDIQSFKVGDDLSKSLDMKLEMEKYYTPLPVTTVIYEINDRIKVDENNCVTLETIKEVHTGKEVRELFRRFRSDVLPFGDVSDGELNEWLDKHV